MPRRPIGKIRSASGSLVSRSSGRRVSGLGALIVAIAAVPAWWTLGGGTIPEISGNAFDSPGAIGFFAALVVLAGAVGYHLLARLGWLDASYMALTTLFTVGFREMGVRHVLEGSVRRQGDTLRITAQLVKELREKTGLGMTPSSSCRRQAMTCRK